MFLTNKNYGPTFVSRFLFLVYLISVYGVVCNQNVVGKRDNQFRPTVRLASAEQSKKCPFSHELVKVTLSIAYRSNLQLIEIVWLGFRRIEGPWHYFSQILKPEMKS